MNRYIVWGLFAVAALGQEQKRPALAGPVFPSADTHAARLGAVVAGRTLPGPKGGRPIWPVPVVVGPAWNYNPGPAYWPPPPVTVVTHQVAPAQQMVLATPEAAQPAPVRSGLISYSNDSRPYENWTPAAKGNAVKVYLLALKDGSLRQAVAFWRDGDTFHYVTPEKKQESFLFDTLDTTGTRRFNQERGVEIALPN